MQNVFQRISNIQVFSKFQASHRREYMVFIPFSCSLDNFQYFIVYNVPFLLDVFTYTTERVGGSEPTVHFGQGLF